MLEEAQYRPFSKAGQVGKSNRARKPVSPDYCANTDVFPAEVSSSSTSPPRIDVESQPSDSREPAQDTVDDEENAEEFAAPVKRSPVTPSAEEKDRHEATGHAVFRCWCAPCVQGRERNGPHRTRQRDENEVPVLAWDYGFLGTAGAELPAADVDWSPVLCMRDRASQGC